MDKTMMDLMLLGQQFDALPDNMRGYCEPTDIGLKVHVNTIVGGHQLHGQRLIGWAAWSGVHREINPLVRALDELLRQIGEATQGHTPGHSGDGSPAGDKPESQGIGGGGGIRTPGSD